MDLREFFETVPRAALGLSGGTDSSYLLWAGRKLGADVRPYFIKTAFQPAFELEDAMRICEFAGAELNVIEKDVLAVPCVADNPENRCYYCKRAIFTTLAQRAGQDGYTVIIDGTNASDDVNDRPGMKALNELSVRSPLRECGITKDMVRALSAEAGLFTADKPSYACLATRVPAGQPITEEKLAKVEKAESALFEMGYTDFRVRLSGNAAKLQFRRADTMRAVGEWDDIRRAVGKDFSAVALDLKGR